MTITQELERLIELAQSVIERLDKSEALSNVLSQVRLLMSIKGDPVMVALMDILIHGLTNLPYQGKPFTDHAYKDAGIIHMKLCAIEDVSQIDMDGVIDRRWRDEIPIKDHTITLSVYQMENLEPPIQPQIGDSTEVLNMILQDEAYCKRVQQVLVQLRAVVYDKVSEVWIEAVREKERIGLLGPDYRFIIDKLNTIETPVGDELLAAIDNLQSMNPAKWDACALVCRNVILRLAKILWKVEEPIYITEDGTELVVAGEKEKNRLLAYIDVYIRKASPEGRQMLATARSLVHTVYNRGSKGKQRIRHEEAQNLVVDTVHLVDLLNISTELVPVMNIA